MTMSAHPIPLIPGYDSADAVYAFVFKCGCLEIVPLKRQRMQFDSRIDSVLNWPTLVEWSHSQKCFHIADLAESLRSNRRAFAWNSAASFIPLALCMNHDEAHAVCAKLRPILEKREGMADDAEPEDEDDAA